MKSSRDCGLARFSAWYHLN